MTKKETGEKSFINGLNGGYLIEDDIKLIKGFTAEMRSSHQISDIRVLKYYTTLCGVKRVMPDIPIREWDIMTVYDVIERLKTIPNTKGRLYSQNSLHDHIIFLKRFLIWMVENEFSTVPIKKIKEIKPPAVRYDTTDAEELYTEDELSQIISGARTPRDRALIYTLYESGARAGELARLQWKDIVFDKYGVKLYLDDRKNETKRYVRLTMATEPLAQLKDISGNPEPSDYVFVSNRKEPIRYPAMCAILRRAAEAGGVTKAIRPHLFRKTRITDMIRDNFQESVIKESLWGNVSTDMFKTYLRLKESDVDKEFLRHSGVELDDEMKEVNVLKPITCPRCHLVNAPDSNFCCKCGKELSERAILETDETIETIDREFSQPDEEVMRRLIMKMKAEGEI